MSGGYGLNCPTNSFLTNKFGFKGFIGPPCQNDSGQALGIGLYILNQIKERQWWRPVNTIKEAINFALRKKLISYT
jgi:predicted NodU family carbamoyl transferase